MTIKRQIVIGTNRAIYILDRHGKQETVLSVEYDTGDYVMYLHRLDDSRRLAVHYHPSYFLGLVVRESMPAYLIEYGADGRESSGTELPPLHRRKPLPHQPWFGALTSPMEATFLLKTIESGLFKTKRDSEPVGTKFDDAVFEEYYRILPFPLDFAEGLENPRVRLYAAGVAFTALVGAAGCWWVSRRLAITGARWMLWIVLGLLFGPVGSLLMALVQEIPARIACAQCRKPRLVTRDLCEHCGAKHGSPPVDGTEIFNGTAQ